MKIKRYLAAFVAAVMILPQFNVIADEMNDVNSNTVESTYGDAEAADVTTDIVTSEGAVDVSSEEMDNSPAPISLLPLEEVRATLDLTGYLPGELKNIKVSDLLSDLYIDGTNEPIEVDKNAVYVWSNFFDETGTEVYDKWQKTGINDTMNIFSYDDYYSTMEIIVGSGNQLDPGNVRYLVSIKTSGFEDVMNFDIYDQKNTDTGILRSRLNTDLDIYWSNYLGLTETADGKTVKVPIVDVGIPYRRNESDDLYMHLSLKKNRFPDADIKVYDGLYTSLEEVNANASKEITDSITAEDMNAPNAGFKGKFLEDYDGRFLTIVYERNGSFAGLENLRFNIYAYGQYIWGDYLYSFEGDGKYGYYEQVSDYCNDDEDDSGRTIFEYELYEGYSPNDSYYVALEYSDGGSDKRITKAVVGTYPTLESAASQTDIKYQLFPADPYTDGGYLGNFGGKGMDFTVFVDGDVWHITIRAVEYEEVTIVPVMDDGAPNVGSNDKYFRVNFLYNGEEALDTYVMPYSEDTYYSYGYQTVLVNDTQADMTAVAPEVYLGHKAKVYKDGKPEEINEGDSSPILSPQNFTQTLPDPEVNPANCVKYTVSAENHIDHKNYWVTVVNKQEGPKLFVNGPDEREVFLNNYFDNKHDIFIANVGTEELKNISVTLNATHVKLDDYWTMGGEGNNTLAPFERTSTNHSVLSSAEIANVGKIRLIPDGEGDISGTLTITADGQTPRVIKLTGMAGNPKIDTTSIPESVKYVPYSSIITTNNMHDWNKVTFKLDGGKLPDGVSLLPSGEIYGVPKTAGDYPITVCAHYSYNAFKDSKADFVLTVKENTNENVDNSVDEGYEILVRIPDNITDDEEREFRANGNFSEFIDLWLDGEKLTRNVDYTAEEGSTKTVLMRETMSKLSNGTHTISQELRVDGDRNKELKRSAQNFTKGSNNTNNPNSSGTNQGSSGGSRGGGGGGKSATPTYTVKYVVNGGSEVTEQKVKKGSKISFLATPERAGYRFVGWYKDEALTKPFDKNETITGSATLYAKWEQINCRVWFNSNGGTEAASVEVLGDTVLADLPNISREGYRFAGWFTDENLTKEFTAGDKVTSNMTLYAKWISEEAPDDASEFADVNPSAWYYGDVNWAYMNNIMVGYNNSYFGPSDTIKMSNVVTVLAKLSGDDLSSYGSGEIWYAPYAKWAQDKGITDEFAPDKTVSREDIAVMLVRLMDSKGMAYDVPDEAAEFADSDAISTSAMDSIKVLYKNGILSGRGNGIIDPKGSTSRAEFAALVHRFSSN